MDQRRFNNIAIKLKQLKKSNSFIIKSILTFNTNYLNLERLESLLQCSPTGTLFISLTILYFLIINEFICFLLYLGDDLESIVPYNGDPDMLAICERFFYDVQNIPLFTQRIKCMINIIEIQQDLNEFFQLIETLLICLHNISNSKNLPIFLQIVLLLGNYMNTNTIRSDYSSFNISYLSKLSQVKSGDLKSNLLQFIIDNADKYFPMLINDLIIDLSNCTDALKLSRIDTIINKLKVKLQFIKVTKNSISNISKRNNNKIKGLEIEDKFEENIIKFLSRYELFISSIIPSYIVSFKKYLCSISSYFGFNAHGSNINTEINEILLILTNFYTELYKTKHNMILKEELRNSKLKRIEFDLNRKNLIIKNNIKDKKDKKIEEKKIKIKKYKNYKSTNIIDNDNPVIESKSFTSIVQNVLKAEKNNINLSDIDSIKSDLNINKNDNKKSLKSIKCYIAEERIIGLLKVSIECDLAYHNLKLDINTNKFIVMSLSSDRILNLISTGVGSLNSIKDYFHCNDTIDKIDLGISCFQVTAIDGESRRPKYVSIFFVNQASNLKAKTLTIASQCKQSIQYFLSGVHCEFNVETMDELNEDIITKKLLSVGGAHSPKSFEF
jgi:hypothetical protein